MSDVDSNPRAKGPALAQEPLAYETGLPTVHAGEEVTSGLKYMVRTEILYKRMALSEALQAEWMPSLYCTLPAVTREKAP